MPINSSDKNAKKIAESRHPWYTKIIDALIFWRHAIEGMLDGGAPRPINVDDYFESVNSTGGRQPTRTLMTKIRGLFTPKDANDSSTGQRQNNWLYPYPYESKEHYFARLEKSVDNNFSGHVVNTYEGHFAAALNQLGLDRASDDLKEKIMKNIDGGQSSWKQFTTEAFHELIGMGACIIGVTNPADSIDNQDQALLPNAFVIERENFLDFAVDSKGEFVFARWRAMGTKIAPDGNSAMQVEQIIGYTKDEMYIIERIEGKWSFADGFPAKNPIGKVPIVVMKMGKFGRSIIENSAKFDVLIMNIRSTRENILTKQGVAIPYIGARSIGSFPKNEDGTYRLATDTLVLVHDNETPPGFAQLDSSAVEGHRLLEMDLANQAYNNANLRKTNESFAKSEGSKRWDWKETEAVLKKSKDEIIRGWQVVVELMSEWADQPGVTVSPTFKEFSIRELKEELDIIEQAILIDIAEMGNADARKIAYDLLNPDVDEKKRKEAHDQIDASEKKKEKESQQAREVVAKSLAEGAVDTEVVEGV